MTTYDWRRAEMLGNDVWLRHLPESESESGPMAAVVWAAGVATGWEWEIVALDHDRHIRGSCAASLLEATGGADIAARDLGLA